jgi:Flp pilus assembly pilin Flp
MEDAVILRDTRGASFVEYTVILGVVALLAIGAFAAFGSSVSSKIAKQGASVEAMEGRVRSLESMPPTQTAADRAHAETTLVAEARDGWESASENGASRRGTTEPRGTKGSDGVGSTSGNIVIEHEASGFDIGAVLVAMLVGAGAFLVYRWKRGRRPEAGRTPNQQVEALLAPASRWMAALRGHVAGRLPWTPRE